MSEGTAATTMLFTDIEGSTRLLSSLGEQAYGEVLGLHHRLIRAAIASFGGEEIVTEGDSFFVVFHRPDDAIHAAVAAQLALEKARWPSGTRVRVRMGVHTGPVARAGDNLVGMAIHAAARIHSCAHGGQLIVSEEAACASDLTPPLGLMALGRHRLKDIDDPLELHQVLHPELTQTFPPLRTLPIVAVAPPTYMTEMIGRGDEAARLSDLLTTHRVVTITGPPGIGKTRLGAEVASSWREAAFVDLASLTDTTDMADRIAAAVGVHQLSDESALDALVRQLDQVSVLVVLDNCEHVAGSLAPAVASLTTRCREMRVLSTSRQPLGVDGEIVWVLETLDAAADLFVARARAARSDFDLVASSPEVAAVCEALDSLPLAIELAAAQLRTMSMGDLRQRLEDRFALLRNTLHGVPERHRTLEAAIEWSVKLLRPDELCALRRLSLMRGPFDLASAEAVCETPSMTITALLDRSLLTFEIHDGAGRYRMLATIRDYAARLLAESDDGDAAGLAHARVFARRASERLHERHRVTEDLSHLDADIDNYRGAVEWFAEHDPAAGLDLVGHVEGLWMARPSSTPGLEILEKMLEHASDAPAERRAAVLVLLADIYRNRGRLAEARSRAEEATDLVGGRATGRHFSPRTVLGQILAMQGELTEAEALFEQSLVEARTGGHVTEATIALRELANIALERNDPDGALPMLEDALEVGAETHSPMVAGMLGTDMGRVALAQGRLADARAIYENHLERLQALAIPRAIAGTSLGLARVARHQASPQEAAGLLAEAVRIYRRTGDDGGLAHALVEGALQRSATGAHEEVVGALTSAECLRARLGIATPGSEVPEIESARVAAVTALGADATRRLVERARHTPLDEVIGWLPRSHGGTP